MVPSPTRSLARLQSLPLQLPPLDHSPLSMTRLTSSSGRRISVLKGWQGTTWQLRLDGLKWAIVGEWRRPLL